MVEEGYQVRIEWIDFEMENAWSGTKCKFDYAALVTVIHNHELVLTST